MSCGNWWCLYNWSFGSCNLPLPLANEGRTASEWHSYSVDLQEGYAQLAKELREKSAKSDELRLLNQGREKAHKTVVEALEAVQLSHGAVLLVDHGPRPIGVCLWFRDSRVTRLVGYYYEYYDF